MTICDPTMCDHSACDGAASIMSEACRSVPNNQPEHQYRDFFAMHVLILHDVVRQLSTPLEVCLHGERASPRVCACTTT